MNELNWRTALEIINYQRLAAFHASIARELHDSGHYAKARQIQRWAAANAVRARALLGIDG